VPSRIVVLVEQAGPSFWQRVDFLDVDADGKFQCARCFETCVAPSRLPCD
jgi:hypothetical protein